MIKAVIYDVDGTLVDTLELMAMAAKNIAVDLGLKGDFEKIPDMVGLHPEEIIKVIFRVSETEKVKFIKEKWAEEALRLVVDEKKARLFPGVMETLNWLKANGFKIGLGSSLMSHMIKAIGEAYGFIDYVDAYVGSDQVERGKPDPETFLRAAELLDVSPTNTIVVGDTMFDIIAGRRGGFLTVLYDPYKRLDLDTFETRPKQYIIRQHMELIDIIKYLNNL